MEKAKVNKAKKEFIVSSKTVAEIVGTSVRNVNQVRAGNRGKEKRGKAAEIQYVDNRLHEEVRRLVPIIGKAIKPMN